MNWVMEHMADPDFAEPFVPPGAKKDSGKHIFTSFSLRPMILLDLLATQKATFLGHIIDYHLT